MASERFADAEQTKPLEDRIADLNLQEKAGVEVDAAQENLGGTKEVSKISVEEGKKGLDASAETVCESLKGEKKSSQHAASHEENSAKEEVKKSPDEGAYVVPTVDHRCTEGPGGEEKKVDLPSGVVHENANPVDEPQQQGKGLIQSVTGKISKSVKSVFSSFTGGKAGKSAEVKSKDTSE